MLSQQDTKTWPLSAAIETFLADRHIATLTTLRPDGTPHVVPVSFSWDSETRRVRILAGIESRKVKNLITAPESRVAVCQADGRVWVTLEGTATVSEDPGRVAEGRRRYIERYRRASAGAGEGNGGPGGGRPGGGPGGGRPGGGRPGGGPGGGGPGGGPGGGGPGPMGNGLGRRAQGRDPLDSWQAVIEITVDRVMSRNL
jgi:F420H(2)-dependent biliverdin reductase